MKEVNRTKIGIKATAIVVIEAMIIGVLSMLRTRYILRVCGSNVNGVLQLATHLSSYMLLFESGMTAAYQFNMYKPMINDDYDTISGLYTGMKYNLKSIAAKMFLCSMVIAVIYSFILQNRGVSYGEAVAILAVMGARLVCPYVFTISLRTLLIVKERKYVTDIIECIKNTVTIGIEIILILRTNLPLYEILSIYIFITLLSKFAYTYLVKAYYGERIYNDAKKNLAPKQMTSDILTHKVAGLITDNTDTVLLSFVKSYGLNSVTIYTSFYTIVSYPITLATRVIDSMRASLALKAIQKPLDSYDYFREILSFSKLTVMMVIPLFIAKANDFVELWIGPEYQLDRISMILMASVAAHKLMIPTVYAIRDAKGLYKESKGYVICQAIVNMIISVALVVPLGIKGILIGTVVSDWLFLEPFNIKLVFDKVFCRKFDMWLDYLILFIYLTIVSVMLCIVNETVITVDNNWSSFIISFIGMGMFVCGTAIVSLLCSDFGFRHLMRRFVKRRK